MKGGSITKILIESIACAAAGLAFGAGGAAARTAVAADPSLLHPVVRDLFLQYEVAVRHAYAQAEGMEALIDSAGASITTPVPTEAALAALAGAGSAGSRLIVSPTGFGRIVYLGVGTAGLLGLIDASECNPTYGSLFNSVRGFLAGAWATVANKQGPQSLPVPAHMRCDAHLPTGPLPEFIGLGLEAFTADFLPTVNAADTIVLTYLEEVAEDAGPGHLAEALAALDLAKAAGARVLHAAVVTAPPAGCTTCGSADVTTAIRRIAPQGVVISLPAVRLRLSLPLSAAPSACGSTAAAADGAAASESVAAACGAAKHQVVAFDALGAETAAAPSCLAELCLKLVLNATTMGAHVRKGMIYRNRMINLMLTNAKLFHRAVGIVADTCGAPAEVATRSVLRAIYHSDDVFAPGGGYVSVAHLQLGALAPTATARDRPFVTRRELEGRPFAEAVALPVSNHVHNASSQRNIVPTAIVLAVDELARQKAGMARPLMAEAAAVAMLEKQPVVRLALLEVLKGST
jgi:N-acetylmuramic acid 6-phosphate (MurNAc-6-P) etherase